MARSCEASNQQRNKKGRKKIRMEKMKNKSSLQVTFSKRRSGLFKKASELCTLTGCKIGIIVFSPGRKVFSFGHPSVQEITEGVFPNEGERNDTVLTPQEIEEDVAEQTMHLSMVEMEMEMEKKKSVLLEKREKEEMMGQPPIMEMMEPELLELYARLNKLKESIIRIWRNHVHMGRGNQGLNFMNHPDLNVWGGMGGVGLGYDPRGSY